MDDSRFSQLAGNLLSDLFAKIEAVGDEAEEPLDVDFDGEVMTIDLADGRQYVINKHMASRQIWLSSPVSGASHYRFDDATERWVNTRENNPDFVDTLFAELAAITGSDFGPGR